MVVCPGGHWRSCYGPCGEQMIVAVDTTCIPNCGDWSPEPSIADDCATCETSDDCAMVPSEGACCDGACGFAEGIAVSAEDACSCDEVACRGDVTPRPVAECSEFGTCIPNSGVYNYCESDADCIAVTAGCCECGGQRTAIRADDLEVFKYDFCPTGSWVPEDCAPCAEERDIPTCLNNQCVLL